jgi:hypothetical protein
MLHANCSRTSAVSKSCPTHVMLSGPMLIVRTGATKRAVLHQIAPQNPTCKHLPHRVHPEVAALTWWPPADPAPDRHSAFQVHTSVKQKTTQWKPILQRPFFKPSKLLVLQAMACFFYPALLGCIMLKGIRWS